ncbi:MAG: hypothetical protein ACE14S_10890 [Candidatus Bathyarchaeia archaeon]
MAERIAAELHLSREATHLLADGSVGPDSHADFPHATGKDSKILRMIGEARTFFLENDDYCYGVLGNALHYVQDKWVPEETPGEKSLVFLDDTSLQRYITDNVASRKALKDYSKAARSLVEIKNQGIDHWFDYSWGFWHKDYAGCVFVFADILELMLPTLKPEFSTTTSIEDLRAFAHSEDFRARVGEAFAFSLRNNLKPKLSGYPAAICHLALTEPPVGCRDSVVDLNIAYRLSVEIARHVLLPPEKFKFSDDWTIRKKIGEKCINLTLVVPQYHILVPKPVEEVQAERERDFEEARRSFLADWSSYKTCLQSVTCRSDVWKVIFTGLVELLGGHAAEA